MDFTLYLPDALGTRVKDENNLNLSRLLRDAVTEELERREAMKAALNDPETHELDLEDRDGREYTGRITGKLVGGAEGLEVFLTDDERVIVYVQAHGRVEELQGDHLAVELRDWFRDWEAYGAICAELGVTPVKEIVDL